MNESEQNPKKAPLQPVVEPRENPPIDEERLRQVQEAMAEVSGH